MPVLDGIKASLTDHLQTLIKKVTLGSSGGESSNRDANAGNAQITTTPTINRIDDRIISMTAVFDTQTVSSNAIKEIFIHGDSVMQDPSYRATFLPINKDLTNEIRVDVLMEIR